MAVINLASVGAFSDTQILDPLSSALNVSFQRFFWVLNDSPQLLYFVWLFFRTMGGVPN